MRLVSTQLHPSLSLFSLSARLVAGPRLPGAGCSAARCPHSALPISLLHSYSSRIDLHVGCNCGLRWPGRAALSALTARSLRHSRNTRNPPSLSDTQEVSLIATSPGCTAVYSEPRTQLSSHLLSSFPVYHTPTTLSRISRNKRNQE